MSFAPLFRQDNVFSYNFLKVFVKLEIISQHTADMAIDDMANRQQILVFKLDPSFWSTIK